MKNDDSIVIYRNYGKVVCSIKNIMEIRNITKTQLAKKTGLHHRVLDRYITGDLSRFDQDVLAKLCYILKCDINDIIHYEEP